MKVDMHCHTRLSKDSLNDPRRLVQVAAERGLGALCVTDHNGLANALALSRMPDLPIRVVPSEEVKTSEGEIIGYFLSELVPKGLSPEETLIIKLGRAIMLEPVGVLHLPQKADEQSTVEQEPGEIGG